jgi:hypothetical protein
MLVLDHHQLKQENNVSVIASGLLPGWLARVRVELATTVRISVCIALSHLIAGVSTLSNLMYQ